MRFTPGELCKIVTHAKPGRGPDLIRFVIVLKRAKGLSGLWYELICADGKVRHWHSSDRLQKA